MDSKSTQPPLSSKGGYHPQNPTPAVKPSLAVNLDWLRWSVKYNDELSEADNLRAAIPTDAAYQLTGEMVANAKGYDSAMKLSIGVIHWHTERHTQGISIEIPGSGLTMSRAAHVEDMALIKHIGATQGRVSTMDSALDVYNADSSKDDVLYLHENGSLQTTARDVGQYSASKLKGGEWKGEGTVYIGSAKSPKQIKIYNAYAKHGGTIKDWVRVEMRWRGAYARGAHVAMIRFGIEAVTRKAILQMLNADIEWFQYALTGELADIEPVRRKDTNTIDWLIDFVAPILKRELDNERAQGEARLLKTYEDIIIQGVKDRRAGGASQRKLTRVSKP